MGSEARARLGLAFLLVASLFAFNQVFAGGDYPGPAILGMLIATGIAVGARRLGLGTFSSLGLSIVGLATYLSLVFQADHTLWGLPTPGSIAGLWRAVTRAMDASRVDFAPVPVRAGYAILVVAAMWVAAAIGELATFRWRRPLVAGILPVAIFSVSLVVGTGEGSSFYVILFLTAILTYWGLESSHRLRSWGRWVGAWTHQREAEPKSLTGGLARRIGMSCVALAFISPLFLPALGDGLLSWRSGIGPGIGDGDGEAGGELNPWVSLKPTLVEQTDEVLFSVNAAGGAYWRIASLEVFNGTSWEEFSSTRQVSEGGVIGGPAGPLTSSAELDQTITIDGLEGNSLPVAPAPTNVARIVDDDQQDLSGIGYDQDSGAIRLDEELDEDDVFDVTSQIPTPGFGELRRASPGDPGAHYFEAPALTPEVETLRDVWIAGAKSPYEELVALQQGLRLDPAFDYDLEPPEPESDDYLHDFLIRSKSGFCQQYASAFALLARSLGYPARVSVGFLPGEQSAAENTFTVRGTDAHAWPEVYLDGFGWIAFEPTPRPEAVTPDYTSPSSGAPFGGADPDNLFSSLPGQFGGAFRDPGEDTGPGGLGAGAFPTAVGEGEGILAPGPQGTPRWQKTFTTILFWLAIALALFLLAVPAIKEWRTRRRYAQAKTSDEIAAAAFAQFQDEAADLALQRSPSESALSFAVRMATSSKVAERPAVRLASIYEAAAYAADDITPDQAREAKRLAARLRSQLWHHASWWSRMIRLFSPRRLRALT
jgi:transglutaminase-like putative cysteine protease